MTFPISGSSDTEQLQQLLTGAGFPVTVDGILGTQTTAAVKNFQANNVDADGNPLAVDGIVGPATWASLLKAQPVSAEAPPTGPSIAGFDTGTYPGDSAMTAWKSTSPYVFVGYYLASPLHPGTSWMGKRETLESMGWQLAVLYVGRQANGTGGSSAPDHNGGLQHGTDAINKTTSEGFAPGTVVYLDVEPMDSIPQGMFDYMNAWISQFTSGTAFRPGVYCHIKNAEALRESMGAAASDIPFWITGSGHFEIGLSQPTECGISYANIWQGTFNQSKTFGGVTISIDENVADTLQGPAVSNMSD